MKNSVYIFTSLFATVAFLGMQGSTLAAEPKLSGADKEFAMKAAEGGLLEVKLGEIAKAKADRNDLKEFAELMITDHSKANANLAKIAKEKGMTLPTKLNSEQTKSMDRLLKLSGRDFDAAYVELMVEDHKSDIAEFEKASKDLSDTSLKAFATKTLPALKTHLEKIEAIQGPKPQVQPAK